MSEHDPPRMRELALRDSELSELLEAGARDVAPPDVLARSAARLGSTLGISIGPLAPTTPLDASAVGQSAAAPATSAAAATHTAAASTAVAPVLGGVAKSVLALALVSATGVAVWSAGHERVDAPHAAPEPAARQSARIAAPARIAVPAVPAARAQIQTPRPTPSVTPTPAPEPVQDMPAITSGTARTRARVHSDAVAPSSASKPPPSTTAEELRNLQAAQAELATRPEYAVQRLRAHALRYPRGWLEEERAALLVEALLRAGDVAEATRALAALRADHPRSPAIPRLQRKLDATR